MRNRSHDWDGKTELNRLDRIVLHLRCLFRDHMCRWHLAGIWRECNLKLANSSPCPKAGWWSWWCDQLHRNPQALAVVHHTSTARTGQRGAYDGSKSGNL